MCKNNEYKDFDININIKFYALKKQNKFKYMLAFMLIEGLLRFLKVVS
jgi:hypothetical protein